MKKIKTIIQSRKNRKLVKKGYLIGIEIFHWFSEAYVFTFCWVWSQAMSFCQRHLTVTIGQTTVLMELSLPVKVWTWSLFLVFSPSNSHPLISQPTNHFRIIWGGTRSPGWSENLLWTPAGKIKKVPASNLQNGGNDLEENSGNQRGILLKNCCITGFLGGSKNDSLKQANKQNNRKWALMTIERWFRRDELWIQRRLKNI